MRMSSCKLTLPCQLLLWRELQTEGGAGAAGSESQQDTRVVG